VKLVVGLGNPGKEYQGTRHNLGFMVVEELVRRHGVKRQEYKHSSVMAWLECHGEEVVVAKPLTYMNRSGQAVKPLVSALKLNLEDVLVICDDLDLETGRIRIRPRGGSGGHRGLASVISSLGTEEFARLRVGIGRPPTGEDVIDYVLDGFTASETETMARAIARAADAVETWIGQGIEKAMNTYNFSERCE